MNSKKILDKSLFTAIQDEDFNKVCILLKKGADPNYLFKSYGGVSAFHIAVGLDDNIEFTKLFLDYKADAKIKSVNEKWTPLHVCAYHNKPDSLEILLKNNPNIIDELDYEGRTALDIAIEQENNECVKILEKHKELIKNSEYDFIYVTNKATSVSSLISADLTLGFENDEEELYNFKTSTFDEEKLKHYIDKFSPPTTPKNNQPEVIDLITSDDDEEEKTIILSESNNSSVVTFKTANTNNKNDYEKIEEPNEIYLNELNDQIDEIYSSMKNTNVIDIEKYKTKGYSTELIQELVNKLDTTCTSDIIEARMFKCFGESPIDNTSKKEWREGVQKSAFNYLLIDPRVTKNLPIRAKSMSKKEVFRIFVSAIFYIGKGSRARPYQHLYDSLRYWKSNVSNSNQNCIHSEEIKSKKVKRIVDIWNDKMGVVSLHCFQSVIPTEAYTREAAMIDAMNLVNLTNVKKGNYYGETKSWTFKKKCELGTILLRRACAIFLAEGERQITPNDL